MQTYKISETEKTISLEYLAPDNVSSKVELAHLALEGVFSLAEGLFEPLKIDLSINFNDEYEFPVDDEYPPHRFWMLKHKKIPKGISADTLWLDEEVSLTDSISKETTLEWLKQAIASNQPNTANDYTLGWEQLIFKTNRCHLPVPREDLINNCIPVQEGLHTYQFPVELKGGESWISGPIDPQTMYAPIEVSISNQINLLTLNISFYWSVYTSPGSAGLKLVRQATEKLIKQGWEVTQDSLPE